MDDLIAFLRARLDEDERTAEGAHSDDGLSTVWRNRPGSGYVDDLDGSYVAAGLLPGEAAFIARNHPQRVHDEVAAKRLIMKIHAPRRVAMANDSLSAWCPDACDGCGYGGDCDDPIVHHTDECPILRALASPFSFHPDYRESWSPNNG